MRQKPSCQRCMRWLLPKREDGNFRASHFSTIPRRTSTSARQIASYTDRAKRGQPFSAKDRSNYPQLLSQLWLHKRTRKIKQINPRWAPSSHHTTWLSQKSNTMKENPRVSHTHSWTLYESDEHCFLYWCNKDALKHCCLDTSLPWVSKISKFTNFRNLRKL